MQRYQAESINKHEKPRANLSCLQCQRRKKKCDKTSPCEACRQAGIACTPISRPRLPRGRHAAGKNNNDDLRERVARLEQLLSSQSNAVGPASLTPPKDDISNDYQAPSWSSIHEEVFGIREIVDALVGDEEDDPPLVPSQTEGDQSFDTLMYTDTSNLSHPDILQPPPNDMVSALIDIYLYRVDKVFKVTHAPSLRSTLLGANELTPAQKALKSAVCFTAVNSLDEQKCLELLGLDKTTFSGRIQAAVEILLSRAGLHTTTDVTALQAFIIYLVGLRARNGCRAVCVMLASAVRIGQCLGLDVDKPKYTPFQRQMRRRIWCSIGTLDLHASFDVGSYSALVGGATFKDIPLHINDADISPQDVTSPREVQEFSDMTFNSATHTMLKYMRKMIHTPMDLDGYPIMQQTWAQRNAIVEECAVILNEKYAKKCNDAEPFQCFTKIVCNAMITTLRLLVRRPMYRLYNTAPPPKDEFNVLNVATDVLDQTLQKARVAEFKPWEWFSWVKWYALAVLLAELCEFTEGKDVDRAWIIAEASYCKLREMTDEAIYRSTTKLLLRARAARNRSKEAAQTTRDLADSKAGWKSGQPEVDYHDAEHQVSSTNSYESMTQQLNVWDEIEMLSWPNWEYFIQELGDPVQLDTNEFY